MGGLGREQGKKLYKIHQAVVGLLVAALFSMIIDYALAGVVIKGEESTLDALIDSCGSGFALCSVEKLSQKQLLTRPKATMHDYAA